MTMYVYILCLFDFHFLYYLVCNKLDDVLLFCSRRPYWLLSRLQLISLILSLSLKISVQEVTKFPMDKGLLVTTRYLTLQSWKCVRQGLHLESFLVHCSTKMIHFRQWESFNQPFTTNFRCICCTSLIEEEEIWVFDSETNILSRSLCTLSAHIGYVPYI